MTARRDDPTNRDPSAPRAGGRSVTPIHAATVRVALEADEPGFRLEASPMCRPEIDAAWRDPAGGRSAGTRLLALTAPSGRPARVPLGVLVDLGGPPIAERFDEDRVVFDETAGEGVLRALDEDHDPRLLVRIDGPVEPADAASIGSAVARGHSPLRAEVRATSAIEWVGAERRLRAWTRTPEAAAAYVCGSLRRLVAGLESARMAAVSRPDPELVLRLLDREGGFEIRARETEVYSTAIDVAIRPGAGAGPATESLIYDRFADSWHGD